ncbi:M23 family metallopeptidase [Microbacterium forte]|uniref:M23 family metallopeptidase n=1 Tax=Microbacterium forte TaxID=2982533 RepID=UPI002892D9C9|nr:M23 family metallopeptidase [Microbacterium sp. A(2022)]
MALTDAPTVTLDGVQLASSWSLSQRIALGGLAITWGRQNHLQPAEPASLKLEVLDTDGQIASSAGLIGKRVTVVRADGRTIYRGRVDDFEIDHVEMNDPKLNVKRRVWRLMLICFDTIADLAKIHPRGPGNEAVGVNVLGPDYWFIERPANRIAALLAAGVPVPSIEWADPYPVTEGSPGLARWRTSSDNFSALNHVEGIYNAHPLAYVRHDPHTNGLTIGRPAATAGVELTWDGDTLDVALADGATVPARIVAMPEGYKARTGAADAIDVVQIISPSPTDAGKNDPLSSVDATTEAHTDRYNFMASGRREHRVMNEILTTLAPEVSESFSWPFPLAYVTSEYGYRASGFHEGIDLSGGPASSGEPIPSAGAGTVVTSVTLHEGWGNYVVVDHGTDADGNNLRTLYAHMIEPGVPVGTVVDRGDTLGRVGNTGNSYGAHLHFETWVNGAHINPRIFMDKYSTGAPAPVEGGVWQRRAADDTAATLNQLNGKVNLPRIRIDWRHFDYPPAIDAAFIDGTSHGLPLYFPGSVFAPVYEAATEHEIIGGTLVYFKGWTLDATLAPAIRTRAGITINQLVTIDAPLISDFDDDMLIADLGNVTKGVTA